MLRPFRVVSGPSVGGWIDPELATEIGSVSAIVPCRYSAYARILHPVESMDGKRLSWEDVANRTGKIIHPRVQWHALLGVSDPDDSSAFLRTCGQPRRGELPVDLFSELIGALAPETSDDAGLCYFAYWTGWAWAAGLRPLSRGRSKGAVPNSSRKAADAGGSIDGDLSLPLLRVKGNDYRVLSGTSQSVYPLKNQDPDSLPGPHAPNMAWPKDRSWFLATDIDYDSTLCGGSRAVVEALTSCTQLTVMPIQPDDLLFAGSDCENPIP